MDDKRVLMIAHNGDELAHLDPPLRLDVRGFLLPAGTSAKRPHRVRNGRFRPAPPSKFRRLEIQRVIGIKNGGQNPSMFYGYARISTDQQDTAAQRLALEAAGCVEIVEEQASGRGKRPALAALLDKLAAGDVVAVWKVDRLSRSVPDFYSLAQAIEQRGASLRSLTEAIDTGTPTGRAMLGLLAVFAQLEAETTSQRTKSGLDAARRRGRLLGRPRSLSGEVETDIAAALGAGATVHGLARKHQVSPATIRRIRKRIDGLA